MADENSNPDYIIVGGGLCGCVLASRLQEGNPDLRILLIEAGADSTNNPLINAPSGAFASRRAEVDWQYQSIPQAHINNRICSLSAGKILSGGTSLNAAIWTRGSRVEYDRWAQIVGDSRWSYDGQLPYFMKSERHWSKDYDTEQHGFDGPIHTASVTSGDPNRRYPLREPLKAAWARLGVSHNPDGNNGHPLGLAETVENLRDGQRQNVRDAYDLGGVQILLNTIVHRVLVEKENGKRRAIGVEIASGKKIFAQKEIILSAGTCGSPKLLLLSGIGPRTDLEQHSIQVVLDAPGVGKNFHEHTGVRQWWKLRDPSAGLALGSPKWTNPSYARVIPSDWVVCQQIPSKLLRSALTKDGDWNGVSHPLLHDDTYHTETVVVYAPVLIPRHEFQLAFDGSYVTTFVFGMNTTSRGTVKLASADPSSPPLLDPNICSTEVDRCMLREGVRQVLRLMLDTPEGNSFVEDIVVPTGHRKLALDSSDEEIDSYTRDFASTVFHAGGTVAMGDVVDSDLKVVGIAGLRVVDASVLPLSIAAHLQVPLYALAEQAADIILKPS